MMPCPVPRALTGTVHTGKVANLQWIGLFMKPMLEQPAPSQGMASAAPLGLSYGVCACRSCIVTEIGRKSFGKQAGQVLVSLPA